MHRRKLDTPNSRIRQIVRSRLATERKLSAEKSFKPCCQTTDFIVAQVDRAVERLNVYERDKMGVAYPASFGRLYTASVQRFVIPPNQRCSGHGSVIQMIDAGRVTCLQFGNL